MKVIIIFVLLHSPRVISSVGEFYVVSLLNKDAIAQELHNFGLPIWLQAVAPISELATVLNSCINIIIYRYLTSTAVLRYCPTCLPCCFRDISSVEVPSALPIANVRRPNTPIEENESSRGHDNNTNLGAEGSSLMVSSSRVYIQTKRHESVHSADHAITMDVENGHLLCVGEEILKFSLYVGLICHYKQFFTHAIKYH